MIDYVAGVAAAAALYWLPGWLFLRRSALDLPTRLLGAVALSYAAVTALAEVLGALDALSQLTMALVLVAVVGAAMWRPLAGGAFEERAGGGLTLPLAVTATVGLAVLLRAAHPSLIRTNDALATWTPLAVDIAETGSVAPEWLQSLLVGFPPSVGLIGGTISLLVGGFAEPHAFIVHPLFTALLLMAVVVLAGQLGGRRGAWIALIAMMGTPLLRRGILFHDDLVVALFVVTAVLLGLRAKSVPAWMVAGVAAGSALAVKHLGIVAALLLGVVLLARRPHVASWAAAAGGWLIGLPWYVWNVVRFGNPIHPLLPELFGEPAEVVRIVNDHDANRLVAERGSIWQVGALTLILVVVGVLAAAWRATRESDRVMLWYTGGLLTATTVFTVAWQATGYASRHTLVVVPSLAALAAYGLAGRRSGESSSGVSAVAIAGMIALMGLVAWGIGAEYYGQGRVPEMAATAPLALLRGKPNDVRAIAHPPDDLFEVFGPIRHAWDRLAGEDPDALVFSFDNRSYYIPQRILSATDLAALPVYDAPSPVERRRALVDAGVGFVVDYPDRAERHPFYEEAFWQDLRSHPELYEPLIVRDRVNLYRVVTSD